MLNQIILSGNLGHDPETRYCGENQDQPVTKIEGGDEFQASDPVSCCLPIKEDNK